MLNQTTINMINFLETVTEYIITTGEILLLGVVLVAAFPFAAVMRCIELTKTKIIGEKEDLV